MYAHNDHRAALWASFQGFLAWIANQPAPTEILVDGGFTSDSALPKDVDVVFDLTGCAQAVVGHWFGVFVTQRADIKRDHRVDFWIYHPGVSTNDLRAFFEYVRQEEALERGMSPTDLKGLLRVIP